MFLHCPSRFPGTVQATKLLVRKDCEARSATAENAVLRDQLVQTTRPAGRRSQDIHENSWSATREHGLMDWKFQALGTRMQGCLIKFIDVLQKNDAFLFQSMYTLFSLPCGQAQVASTRKLGAPQGAHRVRLAVLAQKVRAMLGNVLGNVSKICNK